jgi:hypothetical protein
MLSNIHAGLSGLVFASNGPLSKWTTETTSTRGLNVTRAVPSSSRDTICNTTDEEEDSDSGDEGEGTEDEELEMRGSRAQITKSTTGLMQIVDGELLIETTEFADIDELFDGLESDDTDEGDD